MDNRTQRQKQAQAERQKALKFQRTVRAAAIVLALVLALISLAQSCSTKKAIEDLAAQIRAKKLAQAQEELQALQAKFDLLKDVDFDLVVGPESRGFIFGVPVAYLTGKGFIPVRKKGKLPRETVSEKYDLEYGQAEIEIHKDAIQPGQKVVVVDDLIATGGSAGAAVKLVERLGGKVVKMVFVMELAGLEGRKKLAGYDVESLIVYPGK